MLYRKLHRFYSNKQPVWIFLRDQQRWVEEALVVEIEGDLVTIRYDAADDDEHHSWEESIRLDSIGAVSTRLAVFNSTTVMEDLETTNDCPESEHLNQKN
ncbi:hypothetical protein PMYN1_Chma476 (chromatophore) [Paulinella micropora]|uniref:Uncharacterized protein n=1 Tax=Paulinella micropora TaxID=1928728 RepID=A0A1L5YCA0_9EUKA|nr:hypothetical protein PMNZ_529 [Paulinella micropora]HRD41722.1 hypothetical protein [Prochlorococcaceae cyanobacterium AMR_MDS_5431]APP88307.1 hypothetical protein PCKR_527 [Paulinella micropora]AQX45074.1 hypothetical protein PFK_527 [Paulinella micropora]AXY63466.1 hypothetical protein PMNZ_529 [Paulinella micropora]BBL86285.1 hypothetical protein PMYN1_Chma476 [Paulinella micropora]